jgi:hypothetical protein
MATGRVPTTANSPLTAKGDLFGYSTTQARVPVGADGETIVADSSTSTGLRYQSNFAAGKNAIINGAFNVWQRGTTGTLTGPTRVFVADRFSATGNGSFNRQSFTAGTAPVAGYEGQYFARWSLTSNSANYDFIQKIEDARTFAGQTVTFSFWAKASATTSNAFFPRFGQNFGTGGSPSSAVYTDGSGINLTTSWVRYTFTAALPSVSGKTFGTNNDSSLFVVLQLNTTSVVDIDLWGWQVEASNTATAFQTATGTIQGELAACQRYLPAFRGEYSPLNGWFTSTTGGNWVYNFAVPARVAPTGITISAVGDFQLVNKAIAAVSPTAITWNYGGTSTASVTTVHTAGSPTAAQGEVGFLRASTSSAYILFTGCEL